MKKTISTIGIAALVCAALLSPAALARQQVGVAISDQQASTFYGGCVGSQTKNCGACGGSVFIGGPHDDMTEPTDCEHQPGVCCAYACFECFETCGGG